LRQKQTNKQILMLIIKHSSVAFLTSRILMGPLQPKFHRPVTILNVAGTVTVIDVFCVFPPPPPIQPSGTYNLKLACVDPCISDNPVFKTLLIYATKLLFVTTGSTHSDTQYNAVRDREGEGVLFNDAVNW